MGMGKLFPLVISMGLCGYIYMSWVGRLEGSGDSWAEGWGQQKL